jgi:hypothetical protein
MISSYNFKWEEEVQALAAECRKKLEKIEEDKSKLDQNKRDIILQLVEKLEERYKVDQIACITCTLLKNSVSKGYVYKVLEKRYKRKLERYHMMENSHGEFSNDQNTNTIELSSNNCSDFPIVTATGGSTRLERIAESKLEQQGMDEGEREPVITIEDKNWTSDELPEEFNRLVNELNETKVKLNAANLQIKNLELRRDNMTKAKAARQERIVIKLTSNMCVWLSRKLGDYLKKYQFKPYYFIVEQVPNNLQKIRVSFECEDDNNGEM